MSQQNQRERPVEQLISVIQAIQRNRMSGMLTVRRGDRATYEEGVVTFVEGQVIQAKAERRHGSQAFNWISTWGMCRYIFVETKNLPQPALPLMPPLASPITPPPSVSHSISSSPPSPANIPFSEQKTASLTEITMRSKSQQNTPVPAPMVKDFSSQPHMAPYRTKQSDDALTAIEYKGLSRTHRHLFLLIDGQRTVLELARFLKRDEHGVYELLRDLERANLIKLATSAQ